MPLSKKLRTIYFYRCKNARKGKEGLNKMGKFASERGFDVGFPKNRTVINSNLLTLNSNCHNEKQQI